MQNARALYPETTFECRVNVIAGKRSVLAIMRVRADEVSVRGFAGELISWISLYAPWGAGLLILHLFSGLRIAGSLIASFLCVILQCYLMACGGELAMLFFVLQIDCKDFMKNEQKQKKMKCNKLQMWGSLFRVFINFNLRVHSAKPLIMPLNRSQPATS